MGTKTISIMDDAYEILVRNKHNNESFSDVIRRSFKKTSNIMDFAGAWKNMPEKDFENIKNDIKALKEKSTRELKRRIR